MTNTSKISPTITFFTCSRGAVAANIITASPTISSDDSSTSDSDHDSVLTGYIVAVFYCCFVLL